MSNDILNVLNKLVFLVYEYAHTIAFDLQAANLS